MWRRKTDRLQREQVCLGVGTQTNLHRRSYVGKASPINSNESGALTKSRPTDTVVDARTFPVEEYAKINFIMIDSVGED